MRMDTKEMNPDQKRADLFRGLCHDVDAGASAALASYIQSQENMIAQAKNELDAKKNLFVGLTRREMEKADASLSEKLIAFYQNNGLEGK